MLMMSVNDSSKFKGSKCVYFVVHVYEYDSYFLYRISLQRFRRRKRSYGLGEQGQARKETVLSVPCSSKQIYLLFWSCFRSFLAHLSQRLIGELLVYKGIRRPSVCQHFQTTSPLKPRSRFFSYFTYSIYRSGEQIIVFFVQVG